MKPLVTVKFEATPELQRELEANAARLNMSLSAYILYLNQRVAPGVDADRHTRHVEEVFGRHGDLMRRLAK